VAVDPNGDIRHVEFFANGVFIGRSDQWTKEAVIPGRPRVHFLDWKPAVPGSYRLSARAVDTQGNPVESKPIAITVGAGLAVVSFEATVWETSEPAPNLRVRPGVFTVRRTGSTANPLSAFLRYEGSATPGADYKALPDQISFLAGEAEKPVRVEPVEDSVAEGIETVVATVFEPVDSRTAAAVIFDRVRPEQGALEFALPDSGSVYQQFEPIPMLVAAYHPTANLVRVDFYADEKLIGTSEIILDKLILGGLILHHFDWQDPLPGDHVLTARVPLPDGTVLVSSKIQIHVQSSDADSSITPVTVTLLSPQPGVVSGLKPPAHFSFISEKNLWKQRG
jgi:hypothetical protein